jgi:hypothetical protein
MSTVLSFALREVLHQSVTAMSSSCRETYFYNSLSELNSISALILPSSSSYMAGVSTGDSSLASVGTGTVSGVFSISSCDVSFGVAATDASSGLLSTGTDAGNIDGAGGARWEGSGAGVSSELARLGSH